MEAKELSKELAYFWPEYFMFQILKIKYYMKNRNVDYAFLIQCYVYGTYSLEENI